MYAADQRDLHIKSDENIDEDNYIFDMIKDDEEKLLENIEKDDPVMRNIREINKDEVYDVKTKEKINLENFLIAQKRKWAATIPTVLEFYNSGVTNPTNKFIL